MYSVDVVVAVCYIGVVGVAIVCYVIALLSLLLLYVHVTRLVAWLVRRRSCRCVHCLFHCVVDVVILLLVLLLLLTI